MKNHDAAFARYVRLMRWGRWLIIGLTCLAVAIFLMQGFFGGEKVNDTPFEKKGLMTNVARDVRYHLSSPGRILDVRGEKAFSKSQSQVDLKGNVHLETNDGLVMKTRDARVNLEKKTIQGSSSLTVESPRGLLKAKRFKLKNAGEQLELKGGVHFSLPLKEKK